MKRLRIPALLELSILYLLAVGSTAAAAQTLLVVNQGDSNMSFVDPVSGREVATVAEGIPGVHAHEVAVTADGKTAFLPIYGSTGVGKPGLDGHEMLVVDVASRKVIATVDFGHDVRPHLPVMDSAHGLVYVTTELDNSVTAVDAKTFRIVGTIPTGEPQSHMLVVSHDGRLGYTANVGAGTVSVLDLVGRKRLTIIPVVAAKEGSGPWHLQRISISNDDKLVFTADQSTSRLAVIDTATRKVKHWIALPGNGYGSASTPDGRWLLIAIPSKNEVAVIDLKKMEVVKTIDVPAAPQEVLVRPDGKVAYVSSSVTGKVAAVNLQTWLVDTVIVAGKGADGLAWANASR